MSRHRSLPSETREWPAELATIARQFGRPIGDQPAATVFSSVPRPSIVIRTTSPGWSVNSSGGTIPVPVSRTTPSGKDWSRPSQEISSSNVRASCEEEVVPEKAEEPLR